MGVIGVPEVKKSIFRLWSGIVLGWSEWPKNAPKRPKNHFFYSWDALAGTPGCHLCIRRRHPSRNMALIHSFMGAERAGKGVGGPALNPHLLERTYTLFVCARPSQLDIYGVTIGVIWVS